jgi:hypothetical protein
LEIAKLLFPDKRVMPLSLEQRAVLEVIRDVNPDIIPSKDSGALDTYIAPKASSRIVKKINDAAGLNLEDGKLNRQYQICIERLGIHLNNSRFLKIMNNYLDVSDRTLFEQEFIRLVWDKPDLTADEINLYLNVCKEIINLEVVSKHLNKLNLFLFKSKFCLKIYFVVNQKFSNKPTLFTATIKTFVVETFFSKYI